MTEGKLHPHFSFFAPQITGGNIKNRTTVFKQCEQARWIWICGLAGHAIWEAIHKVELTATMIVFQINLKNQYIYYIPSISKLNQYILQYPTIHDGWVLLQRMKSLRKQKEDIQHLIQESLKYILNQPLWHWQKQNKIRKYLKWVNGQTK